METAQQPNQQPNQQQRKPGFSITLVVIIIVASLFGGGLIGYSITVFAAPASNFNLQNQVNSLQQQVLGLQSRVNAADQNYTFTNVGNSSFAQIYAQVKDSVVVVQGYIVQYDIFRRAHYSGVQGSGFVYNLNGEMIVITNNHVVQDTVNNTVTFANGNTYSASVLGSDPYADLAALSTEAPETEYEPLAITSSSALKVGDPLIAVGGPYGLAGSMTTGIVSALGRTITAESSSSYSIANIIQTSTPINPGNSGGPLLNYEGQVVGITTAIVSDSQALGFAIPSSTILREIGSLVANGAYDQHPWLGASGTDMNYEIAKAMGVNVTYGWLVTDVTNGGPADKATLKGGTRQIQVSSSTVIVGGDIVIAFDGTRIRNMDDLSTYLEEHTLPNQTIDVTIIRNGESVTLPLKLGTRPSAA
ncbi:MAG TPA: trypsin-like peptidase domain-containing protein [Candidatus Bathyarchaeia archaeon]|nr:trypsin-like peptidase domain-containing protein [Candidatus Bathyarchaeia archaeon]